MKEKASLITLVAICLTAPQLCQVDERAIDFFENSRLLYRLRIRRDRTA